MHLQRPTEETCGSNKRAPVFSRTEEDTTESVSGKRLRGGGEQKMAALSLLDTLSMRMGCTYLSDLHFMDSFQRRQLAEILKYISAGAFHLHEWNDAFHYLTGIYRPQTDAEQSKSALIAWLLEN